MTTAKTTWCSVALVLSTVLACGSGDDDDSKAANGGKGASGGSGGDGASGGSGGSGGSSGGSGGKGGSSGKGGSGGSGAQIGQIPTVPGEPCNSVDSGLPEKPCMVNVTVRVSGNAADIHFDPVDGAADYRVYELPADEDISADGDNLTVKNAIYRCAGTRQTPPTAMDDGEGIPGGAIRTIVEGGEVGGYERTLEDARLGYVSAVPGDGLSPVYALGDASKDADNSCFFMRWHESRVKQYVTSEDERDTLLGKAFRDDGIVFYVPEAGVDGTQPVYTSTANATPNARYYYVDGPEADDRQGGAPAFSVFSEAGDGRVPLMRVYYANGCGDSHDELVAGMARFERARTQSDTAPMTDLHWSGLSGETTLVVEALADGCPNVEGILAPISLPARTNSFDNKLPAWISPEDAQNASPTGELYINGQFDPKSRPRPIARSFVKVEPADPPKLDWFQGFDTPDALGTLTDEPCGNPFACTQEWRHTSAAGDVHFIAMETDRHVIQPVLGELWVAYDDYEADTPGKFRLTGNAPATIADDSFLYATMEVNAFSTSRRYPQMIVSDQGPPLQWNLEKGKSVVIQTFGDWPYVYELEVCDHRQWDVNNQCPRADLYRYFKDGTTDQVESLAPNAEVGDQTGVDRSTHFEVWVSSSRAYLYLNGSPYGCADLPSGAPGAGPATVTFGDTLYHSGVDALEWFDYMRENFQFDTRRHFDNLGYKSGVGAPPWDEKRLPCVSTFKE